jgi:diacylglycerol O-acyltransferase / wax synthase
MSIDRLTAEDQLMLDASEMWPQDVGALALLDGTSLCDPGGRFRIDAVREAIRGRLHLAPRFRQLIHVPRRGLGAPLWVDAPAFDLSHHVRELPLEPPVGQAELLLATEQLRRQRLDPSRPLWEMWFLTGLPDRRIGLFVKIHHTIADGLAAMTIVSAFLDRVSDAPPGSAPSWTPRPLPSGPELVADNLLRHLRGIGGALLVLGRPRSTLRQVREAWPATRELLAEEPAPRTSLDRVIGPDRNLAVIRSRYDLVRKVGRTCDASVNDVVLAITASGLRALLLSRGESVEGATVRVYVPVTMRRRLRGPAQGTQIAQMVVPLSLRRAEPVQRLRQIAAETARRKARTRTSLGTLFGARIVRGLMLKAVIRQRVNVTTASIPGPPRPLYLAGAQMLEVYPVLPLIGNVPLGVGALSYSGAFDIGIAADRDAFPDIDVFAAGVRDELNALAEATRVSTGHPVVDAPRATHGSVAGSALAGVG